MCVGGIYSNEFFVQVKCFYMKNVVLALAYLYLIALLVDLPKSGSDNWLALVLVPQTIPPPPPPPVVKGLLVPPGSPASQLPRWVEKALGKFDSYQKLKSNKKHAHRKN